MAGNSKGLAIGAIGVGGLLLYAGITGRNIPQAIQLMIRGQSPKGAGKQYPIASAPVSSGSLTAAGALGALAGAGSASGEQIAADALQYKGAGYTWGGAPADGIGNWDCSSFSNWVCGHDLGLAIPGYAAGAYTGQSHGPITGQWLLWSGLQTVGNDGNLAEPGDLCVWQTHMGIAIGPNQMISAQSPSSGTQVSAINGFMAAELLYVRRYR